MQRRTKIGLAIGVSALVLVGVVVKSRQAPPATTTAPANPIIELLATDLVTVAAQDVRRSLPFTGTLKAMNQAIVRAKVAGELREVLVREGQIVKAGEVLARIDPLETQAKLDQAVATLAQGQAQLETAKRSYANNKALLDKGFISPTAFSASEDTLKAAQAQVAASQAQVTIARKALQDAVVRAPLNGVIAERVVQPGEKVALDAKLLSVIDPSSLEIEALIPAENISEVRIGQEVRLTAEGLNEPVLGKVARINPATATGSRSVPIYVAITRPGAARSGMFAQGDVVLETRAQVLAVPVSALLNGSVNGNKAAVQVLQDGQLRRATLELGVRSGPGNDAWVEVKNGLSNGQRVLRMNLDNLPAQATVRVAGESKAPNSASQAAAPASATANLAASSASVAAVPASTAKP